MSMDFNYLPEPLEKVIDPVTKKTTYVINQIPVEIAVGHELIHAMYYVTGSRVTGEVEFYDPYTRKRITTIKSEAITVGLSYWEIDEQYHPKPEQITENALRRENGYYERARYETEDLK